MLLKSQEESISSKRNINYMDLTKGSIWQLLRQVTIPASTGSLFQTFYNLVDTYFAGRISPEALSLIHI